jgi:hypothetical protein
MSALSPVIATYLIYPSHLPTVTESYHQPWKRTHLHVIPSLPLPPTASSLLQDWKNIREESEVVLDRYLHIQAIEKDQIKGVFYLTEAVR